jgi:hypothetical protein
MIPPSGLAHLADIDGRSKVRFAPEAAVLLKAAFDPFETSATASNYKSAYAVASGRCVDAAGQFMP